MAGIGDTRLGDDITSFTMSVKHAALAEHARAVEAIEGSGAGPSGRPTTSSWHSSGSSADRNGVWRGGVALGSYGEAQQRVHGHIVDCRGWGRYRGAIYQGGEGRKLVVVQVYFPDSEYDKTDKRCGNYSFELGVLAEVAPSGTSRSSYHENYSSRFPEGVQKGGNPTMTTSMITAGRRGGPQHMSRE